MTREIKFRGKSAENHRGIASNPAGKGEWVYGSLGHDPRDGSFSIFEEELNYWVRVEPDTVGQFTGLKDKNGREIYEGDIVRIDWMNDLYSVVYDCASFLISATGTIRHDLFNVVKGAEVLGNINDNPELLDK